MSWYTITIVEHQEHPRVGERAGTPVELIGCTVLPHLAGAILRTAADEIDPPKPTKPVMRGVDHG